LQSGKFEGTSVLPRYLFTPSLQHNANGKR